MSSKAEIFYSESSGEAEAEPYKISTANSGDGDQLAKLGKKPVLKRNFNFISILSLSVTVLITWEASLVLFSQGLENGGPGGLVYTYIIIWVGNLSTFSALCELVSMAPTSAGQYHWVHMLAPKSSRNLLSFITGWITAAGWQGSVASAAYLCGNLSQGLAVLTVPSYVPTGWQNTLLSIGIAIFCLLVALYLNFLLPKIEVCILVMHITAFVGILVTMVTMGEHGDAHSVFATFNNGGNWPTQGLSVLVGMIGNAFAFIGADAAFHLAEEIHKPSIYIPRAMVSGMLINGVLGLAMLIAVCFSLVNLPDGPPQFIFPMLDVFFAVTKSVPAAAAMGSVIATMGIFALIGLFVSASRVLWSFARDHGVPGWRSVSKVSTRTQVPIWAVTITAIITSLLTLINIGSEVALNDVLSLSISCLYASYLITLVFFLYRRLTGAIVEPYSDEQVDPDALVWGPWRIGGLLGTVNNIFACCYLAFVLFFSFWPPATPVKADTMNYSFMGTLAVIGFSTIYYFATARKQFSGPIVEVHTASG
ncbi:GABA permease [Cordyceps fumosorosea ARSEF 2679]|uniref:GABA permease n=1 Tax=Cordyceps fumosorosea (strain ARSEF 2679) TaxID=1081104 RepID=A0A168D9D5_CORFA|nr:GABA permease [Cordyceps fumosorosea ARSEF 2679]OAA72318.1 GABA permease [Cordyceps fumosorosea ARSEF 2679]